MRVPFSYYIGVLIYAAGWQATNYEHELALIKAGAITHRCVSFAYVYKLPGFPFYAAGPEASYRACLEHGVGIMMDSGVFSFRAYRRKLLAAGKSVKELPTEEAFISEYVGFCRSGQSKWDFAVTVDLDLVAGNNFARHQSLEKLGIRTVPVIHGDDQVLDYIKRYKDRGYDYIAVSSPPGIERCGRRVRRQYLDVVFNAGAKHGVRFHGLAFTTPWIMLEYPWYSVDSSAWSRSASYGRLIVFDSQTERITDMHVSEQKTSRKLSSRRITNPSALRVIRLHVEKQGYEWRDLQTSYVTRHMYNARTMQALALHASKKHSTVTGWELLL